LLRTLNVKHVVVDVWNYLPPTVNFASLPTFKSSLKSVDFFVVSKAYCLGLIVLFYVLTCFYFVLMV